MILYEKMITINEDYESFEVEIDDSDFKNFIDLKYDAEDVINLAKQLDRKVSDSDLDLAYSVIIKNYDSIDDHSSKDLQELKNWIEEEIYKNYEIEDI